MATEPLFSEDSKSRAVGGPTSSVGISDRRVQWAIEQVARAEPAVNEWRTKAKECYRFKDGHQLSEEDEQILKKEQRPANAFNTAQKFIRYVSGVQRDSPTTLLFNAIDWDNDKIQFVGDYLTRIYDWAVEKSNANAQRARAFEDFLTGGIGWTNQFIDRATDARGLPGYKRLSPFEMLWPENEEVNLGGSRQGCTRWRAHETWIENEEAKSLFEDPYAHSLIDQFGADPAPMTTWPSVDRVPYKIPYVQSYPLDTLGGGRTQRKKNKSRIMEFQWWDNDVGYVFQDPLDQTEQWMTDAEFKEYKVQLAAMHAPPIEDYDRQIGRKWQRMFILNRRYMLEEPSKLPGPRFTFNAMALHFDEHERRFYGFFRVLMDPQRYGNKFFNQMIETIAKQTKGGVVAEIDAFEDKPQMDAFVNEYARVGSVNFVAPGGIGKIKEKQLPQTPVAAMTILQFCINSMQMVTGLSEDSLGLGASTQAGITLKRRQRAGMVLLAGEFDAEEDFRREEGHIFHDYCSLIADDRLIRVGGQMASPPELVTFAKQPFVLEYDLTIDDIERDPNMKAFLAELLMGPLGQTLIRMNKFIPDFLNVLPMPRRWIENLKQQMQAEAEKQQRDAAMGLPVQGGRGAKTSLLELRSKVANKDADTLLKQAKAATLTKKGGQDTMKMILDGLRMSLEERRASEQAQMQALKQASDTNKTNAEIAQGFMPQEPKSAQ